MSNWVLHTVERSLDSKVVKTKKFGKFSRNGLMLFSPRQVEKPPSDLYSITISTLYCTKCKAKYSFPRTILKITE